MKSWTSCSWGVCVLFQLNGISFKEILNWIDSGTMTVSLCCTNVNNRSVLILTMPPFWACQWNDLVQQSIFCVPILSLLSTWHVCQKNDHRTALSDSCQLVCLKNFVQCLETCTNSQSLVVHSRFCWDPFPNSLTETNLYKLLRWIGYFSTSICDFFGHARPSSDNFGYF